MKVKDTKVIDYNKNHYAVMANAIIKGKQTMSLQEAKLIRLLITQIAKNDKDFKTYRVNIKELAKFLEVPDSNLYRDIRNICDKLLTRIVRINTDDPAKPWKSFQWLQLAEYDGQGTITLMLSNQIAPYLLQLNAWFTQYQLKNILAMKSFYSIRLYELLKLSIGEDRKKKMEYMFSIQNLREYLECESKFKKVIDFKKYVLDIAVRDISEYSEYNCRYKGKKTSRSITDIIFYLELKEQKQEKKEEGAEQEQEHQEQKELDVDDLVDQLREIINEKLKTKEYKAILEVANNDVELIKAKYQIAKKQRKIDNLVGWMIEAIKKEYTEPTEKRKISGFNNIEPRKYNYDELEKQLLS